MIKIKKHGKLFEEHEAECKYCGCVFTYTNSDCEEEYTGETKPDTRFSWADETNIVDLVVTCPECGEYYVVKHDIY